MGLGWGLGLPAGGGFTSLCESEHKTVGPCRVKIRKIKGPGGAGTLTEIGIWNVR